MYLIFFNTVQLLWCCVNNLSNLIAMQGWITIRNLWCGRSIHHSSILFHAQMIARRWNGSNRSIKLQVQWVFYFNSIITFQWIEHHVEFICKWDILIYFFLTFLSVLFFYFNVCIHNIQWKMVSFTIKCIRKTNAGGYALPVNRLKSLIRLRSHVLKMNFTVIM